MPKLPVAAIFDVGKTNKKLLLFNEQYEVVHEAIRQIPRQLMKMDLHVKMCIRLRNECKHPFTLLQMMNVLRSKR